MDKFNVYAVRNIKLDFYENAMVSENEKVIIAGMKNMILECGLRYLPMYLQRQEEYELILVSTVNCESKGVKSEWLSLGLISDLLNGKDDNNGES